MKFDSDQHFVSLNQRLLLDACLTSKQLFAGESDQKPPETAVQLSFANQEGKLVGMVGSIYSRPSAGISGLNNWVHQLPQETLPTPC